MDSEVKKLREKYKNEMKKYFKKYKLINVEILDDAEELIKINQKKITLQGMFWDYSKRKEFVDEYGRNCFETEFEKKKGYSKELNNKFFEGLVILNSGKIALTNEPLKIENYNDSSANFVVKIDLIIKNHIFFKEPLEGAININQSLLGEFGKKIKKGDIIKGKATIFVELFEIL